MTRKQIMPERCVITITHEQGKYRWFKLASLLQGCYSLRASATIP